MIMEKYGDSSNTVQVTTATEIIPLVVYHSELFLRINSATTGFQLWKMDAAYNVNLVKDINLAPRADSLETLSFITTWCIYLPMMAPAQICAPESGEYVSGSLVMTTVNDG